MQNNFIDHVKIHVKSGKGGAGSAHLRREKYVDKGGPDGGDGGRGGHVIVQANPNMWTLFHLRYTRHLNAENGKPGGKQRATGRDGQDITIDVPLGTVIKNEEGEIVGEVIEEGDKIVVVEGGKGGLGNWHFRSSTQQTPRYAQPGLPGREVDLTFELKILADVGLVGFPNAGKSTLLSVITAAKPKIGDYEFTTLTPNLGIVDYREHQSFVMADIPGIIEGASEGKGLGHRFLRHIERNALLLFLIPADSEDYKKEFDVLLNELAKFNKELLDKDIILAISKSDMLDEELKEEIIPKLPKDVPHVFISSVAQTGLQELKDMLWKKLSAYK
ncbi:GTPase ObgE [Flavobacteriaceae bacterium Ap0902]|nr:GTPase ObgE [Flavobacteriaceae bacterium Ap0902]